jgi:hypothetical protein
MLAASSHQHDRTSFTLAEKLNYQTDHHAPSFGSLSHAMLNTQRHNSPSGSSELHNDPSAQVRE